MIGLVIGGMLSTAWWRAVFLVSVPVGIFGTIWAYKMLREQGTLRAARKIDLLGNVCLGAGLTLSLAAMTYGIMPYSSSTTGWGNPLVIAGLAAGLVLLAAFIWVENHTDEPLFDMHLFKIRAFSMGCSAQLLSALAYGGFQFAIIVWLQGIWLPLHGYQFEDTPLWSAVYIIPLLVGFMIFGVAGGWLSDRMGARGLSTGGMLVLAAGFLALTLFPANFEYLPFAVVLFIIGASFGVFTAPNTAAIMNALPKAYRGVGSGMRSTFQNAGSPLSMAIFFSIIIIVLSQGLPSAIRSGLLSQGVPAQAASGAAAIPPTGALFAAFLGFNPMQTLLPQQVLGALAPQARDTILGTRFFPSVIGGPFIDALHAVFFFAAGLALLAAVCSFFRGKRFVYEEQEQESEGKVIEFRPREREHAGVVASGR